MFEKQNELIEENQNELIEKTPERRYYVHFFYFSLQFLYIFVNICFYATYGKFNDDRVLFYIITVVFGFLQIFTYYILDVVLIVPFSGAVYFCYSSVKQMIYIQNDNITNYNFLVILTIFQMVVNLIAIIIIIVLKERNQRKN